jgi:hypothetical protein
MRNSLLTIWLTLITMVPVGLQAGIARAQVSLAELDCAKGVQRFQEGSYEEAVPLLRRAVKNRPDLVAPRHYLGLALVRLGKIEEGRRVLSAAIRLDPKNPRLLQDLGLAYLAEGNHGWAVRTLRAAKKLAPADERIRYHLGVAMLRMGEAGSAAAELERARFSDKVDQGSLRLQLGLAYYQDQEWELSRQLVHPLLVGEHGGVARRLVRASYEGEGVAASWISAQLVAAGVVDTNPLYEVDADAPTGAGPRLAGSLTLRPWVDARNLVWGEVSGSRTFYFGEDDPSSGRPVSDASPSVVSASAFYARRFPLEAAALRLSAGYTFDLTFLDGNEPSPTNERPLSDPRHIFLEEHGGHLALEHRKVAGPSTTLRYSLTREAFADQPRSNYGNELSVEHSRTILTDKTQMLAWVSFKHEAADSVAYDAVVPGAGAGASYLAPLDLVLGLRLGYEHENYYDWDQSYGQDRVDNELTVLIEVGRALLWNTRLRAVFQYQRNWSTEQSYDYDRMLGSLNLSWSYE